MIAPINSAKLWSLWQSEFLAMLPAIQNRAHFAFRDLDADGQEEAIQAVISIALRDFVRLVAQNRAHLASPSSLARYAIAQLRSGRRIEGRLNSDDVLSQRAQRKRGFQVQRLDVASRGEPWREILAERCRTTPADVAITRIDFSAWLESLSPRLQLVVNALAEGHNLTELARHLGVTVGRVSQIRRELEKSWDDFQGPRASSRAAANRQ